MNPTEPMSFYDTVELFRDLTNKTIEHTNFKCCCQLPRNVAGFKLSSVSVELFGANVVGQEKVWDTASLILNSNNRTILDVPLSDMRAGPITLDPPEPLDPNDDIRGYIIVERSMRLPFTSPWVPSGWPLKPSPWCLVKVSLNGIGRKSA